MYFFNIQPIKKYDVILPPAAQRQKYIYKKKIVEQSVEMGHYRGGTLWMHTSLNQYQNCYI